MGLAPERGRLERRGLSAPVIATILGARAASTSRLYAAKWGVFVQWCTDRQFDPLCCEVSQVLEFLQFLLDSQRAASTIKVYAAAISACHEGFASGPVFSHPLIARFLRGARRLRPVTRAVAPQWELQLVLEALCGPPFEPIESVSLRSLSLKVALLLALTSAKRVSDLCALSVSPACLSISGDRGRAILRPNPAYTPKVVTSSFRSRVITLPAFYPPPHQSPEEERLHRLCPVRALICYVDRTRGFRSSDQLLVCYGQAALGKPLSAQRLSHWLCEGISLAYESVGKVAPEGLRAHSTRGVATSAALLRGVGVQDICLAASWSSPSSFVRAYLQDVAAGSLSQSVLGLAAERRV